MSHYKHHVFFCTNQRENGKKCCEDAGASELREYAKQRSKELRIAGPGKVRINSAGCLDRCTKGPVLAVYPDAVWYTYESKADIDEIIESHLIGGKIVERLRVADRKAKVSEDS